VCGRARTGRCIMKRLIVTDQSGKIIATGPHPSETVEVLQGQKVGFGYIPLEGQQVHEVDLPEHIRTGEQLIALHTSHYIKLERGVPKLVERR